jgi:hypothetical protein
MTNSYNSLPISNQREDFSRSLDLKIAQTSIHEGLISSTSIINALRKIKKEFTSYSTTLDDYNKFYDRYWKEKNLKEDRDLRLAVQTRFVMEKISGKLLKPEFEAKKVELREGCLKDISDESFHVINRMLPCYEFLQMLKSINSVRDFVLLVTNRVYSNLGWYNLKGLQEFIDEDSYLKENFTIRILPTSSAKEWIADCPENELIFQKTQEQNGYEICHLGFSFVQAECGKDNLPFKPSTQERIFD